METTARERERHARHDYSEINTRYERSVRARQHEMEYGGQSRALAKTKRGNAEKLTTAETTGELDVFRLNRDTLRVDRSQVGVFEERDEVRLGGFLERADRRRLEAEIRLEILSDLTDETLEATTDREPKVSVVPRDTGDVGEKLTEACG